MCRDSRHFLTLKADHDSAPHQAKIATCLEKNRHRTGKMEVVTMTNPPVNWPVDGHVHFHSLSRVEPTLDVAAAGEA